MKNIHVLYLVAVLLFATLTKGQVSGVTASLETDLVNYTVTTQADTTFNRKVILLVTDTLALYHVGADLSELQSGAWQTQLSAGFNPPSATETLPCSTPLCIYRDNENRWVLYIGNYSLMRRYRVTLHYNNHTDPDWTLEF
jgi:hypothetical protein